MKQRRCFVIGGGGVAERKVEGLLAVGADVTVISPLLTDRLRVLLQQGQIRNLEREYQAGDLEGCDLTFIATDDLEINTKVYHESRMRNIWVNSADDAAHCDFILPAVIERGGLSVAISTGGRSPALARAIREELDEYFGADYEQLVAITGEVRRELEEKSLRAGAEAWNTALKGPVRSLIKEGRVEQAKALLLETLGAKS
jgi:precorrin-2 dehydrogenase/sirohydrochlorin ferrochelatase